MVIQAAITARGFLELLVQCRNVLANGTRLLPSISNLALADTTGGERTLCLAASAADARSGWSLMTTSH